MFQLNIQSSLRVLALTLALTSLLPAQHENEITLAGTWDFRLDPNNQGIKESWWTQKLPDTIKLPGYLQAQGFGEKPGPQTNFVFRGGQNGGALSPDKVYNKYRNKENFKSSEILQPLRHYIGPAWYSREINIPKNWKGKHLTLELERCHWGTQVWIDGKEIGSADGLGVAHIYDLTSSLTPGKHKITIRVNNEMSISIGQNAHSISDQTQTTWNGILGKIALQVDDPIWIDDVQIYPNIKKKEALVRVTIGNISGKRVQADISLDAMGYNAGNTHDPSATNQKITITREPRTTVEFTYPIGKDMMLWDEFQPALYKLETSLSNRDYKDTITTSFGMREIGIDGKYFTINGHRIFLRGNCDCEVFPYTGHPPLDVAAWKKIWNVHKEFGLNHARFHSWCPPKAAFTAADEIGIYLSPECSEWSSVRSPQQQEFFSRESTAILRNYGNSPCFTMMALGNESGGKKEVFSHLMALWKKSDPRHVYSIKSNSGSNPPEIDYEVIRKNSGGRIRYQSGWPPKPTGTLLQSQPPQTTIDWRTPLADVTKPMIAHETAQFCSYPDVEPMLKKFTGFLRPTYLEIARDQLRERGMLDQVPAFVEASGRWQIELTKEEMEASLRTPGLAGFHWLALNDFPGQGTAPVGFVDFAWDSKPYVDPATIREFIAPTVLLARLEKRVWNDKEPFSAKLEVSHWGNKPLKISDLTVSVNDSEGKEIFQKKLPAKTFQLANAQSAGKIKIPAGTLKSLQKYTLHLQSASAKTKNHWDFWVFPEKLAIETPDHIIITNNFNAQTVKALEKGATVLMLPKKDTLKGELPMCFINHYWTSFNRFGGSSSNTGLLIDPKHPAFKYFPTDSHANWQWWELLTTCRPIILDIWDDPDSWPKDYRPIIQPVDTWKLNRKLAALAEAKVGKGKLMICSMDIENDLDNRIVARQFRHSLISYMKSAEFAPKTDITPAMVKSIFMSNNVDSFIAELGATITASSEDPDHPASHAIDGNKKTFWLTNWKKKPAIKHPHSLTLKLKKPIEIKGLSYRPSPKQAIAIAKFAIYSSKNGTTWGKAIATGTWEKGLNTKEVNFPPITTQWIKLEILSSIKGKKQASAAEIDLTPADALPSEG